MLEWFVDVDLALVFCLCCFVEMCCVTGFFQSCPTIAVALSAACVLFFWWAVKIVVLNNLVGKQNGFSKMLTQTCDPHSWQYCSIRNAVEYNFTSVRESTGIKSRLRDVVIVGAGPSGLAMAAVLNDKGVETLNIDAASEAGASWNLDEQVGLDGYNRAYDRLCLHTDRGMSGLPFMALPSNYPAYVPARMVSSL